LFGLGAKFRKHRPDRLTRLAAAIEALGARDQHIIDESKKVERLRMQGAMQLHAVCRQFVDEINTKLSAPAVLLSPGKYTGETFDDTGPNLFQINLRGRLLQMEFGATDELYEHDDFRLRYILRGAVRSFSQEFLDSNSIDEQMIFYCPCDGEPVWHFLDGRTYRTGRFGIEFLTAEMERLI
jgi:hypothetical protein